MAVDYQRDEIAMENNINFFENLVEIRSVRVQSPIVGLIDMRFVLGDSDTLPNLPTYLVELFAEKKYRNGQWQVVKTRRRSTEELSIEREKILNFEIREERILRGTILEHFSEGENGELEWQVLQSIFAPEFDEMKHLKYSNQMGSAEYALLGVLGRDEEKLVRWWVAENKNTPVSTLELLGRDEDAGVRWAVAGNEDTPVSTLEHLGRDEEKLVRWWVAGNKNTPVSTLEHLGRDEEKLVRWWVAGNKNTPSSTIEFLARDVDAVVRRVVAWNWEKTENSTLELLVKDVDAGVRSWVAKNRRTSESLLEHLAKDVDVDVRWHVANNSKTPKSALELLVKDEDERVREEAAIGYFPRKKKWVFFT